MVLLILMVCFFMMGAFLGKIWKWRVSRLFAVVVIASSLGSLYVADFPSRSAIFNDVWSLLWFLLNYAIYVGLIVGAGAAGAMVGLLVTKSRRKQPDTARPVSGAKL